MRSITLLLAAVLGINPGFGFAPELKAPLLHGEVSGAPQSGTRVLLVADLSETEQEALAQASALLARIRPDHPDVTEPLLASENRAAIASAATSLSATLPPPRSLRIALAGVGTRSFSPTAGLVEHFQSLLARLNGPDYRNALIQLRDDLADSLRSERKVLLGGYRGQSSGVSLLGVSSIGQEADQSQAAAIGQAMANYRWLGDFADQIGEQFDRAFAVPLVSGPELTSVAAWNEFCYLTLPELESAILLKTIDAVSPDPNGNFTLLGEGTIVVALPFYGETLYFPESLPGSPITIRRQRPSLTP